MTPLDIHNSNSLTIVCVYIEDCSLIYDLNSLLDCFKNHVANLFFHPLLSSVCVTIVANDDAHGIFSFDPASLSSTLIEAGEITTADSGESSRHTVKDTP